DPAAVRAALREALDGSGVEEAAGAPRGPGSYGDEPLSEREVDVLRLIAAGLANKQIARRLDVSTNTVKTHARNIYAKLGVASRTQAAARARELGLV
ncbi:MAG: response regulator transcription factor, partial [Deinococcales bacterium]